MNQINMKKILNRLAKESNITPEEVYAQMEEAIQAAFDNPDPAVRKEWEKRFSHKQCPTPEEFIASLAEELYP